MRLLSYKPVIGFLQPINCTYLHRGTTQVGIFQLPKLILVFRNLNVKGRGLLRRMKNTHTFKLDPNLFKLIKVSKTIPVGTATVERSFSAVNRLLRWARNSLSVLLASDLMLLSMNKDMLWSINVD